MSLFTNQNFISQIIKQQGASDYFDNETYSVLQALVQAQTRKMVQKASKFMQNDCRDNLTSEDIENSIKQLGHEDLLHQISRDNKYLQQNNQYLLDDPSFKDITSFIQEQMKSLQSFSMPTLRGRYIYINKKIPKTNQNHQLKSLQDIRTIKAHQDEQKKRNFNIIRDEPQSQLTKEEIDYYNEIVGYLTNNVGSATIINGKDISDGETNAEKEGGNQSRSGNIEVKGCIVNVLPLMLKFILNLGVNENCINFLLKAIENKYVWSSLQFNMHQILILLVSYQGPKCFQVGCKIGYIVNRYAQKYPNLYDIFESSQNTLATITKKIGFQLTTGIRLELSLAEVKDIEAKAQQNNTQASICFKCLIQNWSIIQCLKEKAICDEFGYVYWYGCRQMDGDVYLNMY